MKPQVKGQVTIIIGNQVHTGPLAPEQYELINPGFWMVLARIQARMEREMREKQAEVAHDESAE